MKKSSLIILIVVLLSLIVSAYIWYQAMQWQSVIINDDSWYSLPELSRMEVRDTYDLAFKKILLLNLIVFGSVFLWLKVRENK